MLSEPHVIRYSIHIHLHLKHGTWQNHIHFTTSNT